MRVLVTGPSGHIASAVIPELLSARHAVTGLARSDRSAAVVRSLGAEVWRGDLDDLDGLSAAGLVRAGKRHVVRLVGAVVAFALRASQWVTAAGAAGLVKLLEALSIRASAVITR